MIFFQSPERKCQDAEHHSILDPMKEYVSNRDTFHPLMREAIFPQDKNLKISSFPENRSPQETVHQVFQNP